MSRHLDIPGLGKMSERLVALDNVSRSITYELMEPGPSGMDTYRCEVQVVPGGQGESSLRWNSEFEALPGQLDASVGSGLEEAYQGMSQGLESYINNSK